MNIVRFIVTFHVLMKTKTKLFYYYLWERIFDGEILNVTLDQVFACNCDHRTSNDVQISIVKGSRGLFYAVRSNQFDICGSFRQNDSYGQLINNHGVEHMIHESHLQDVIATIPEQVLVRRNVVTENVSGFPSTEKGKSRAQHEFDRVVLVPHVRS
jgi:hypothetical protein